MTERKSEPYKIPEAKREQIRGTMKGRSAEGQIRDAVISLVKEAMPNNTSEHEVRLNVAVQSLKHRFGMIGLVRLLELIDQVLYDDTFKKSAQKKEGWKNVT